MKAVIIFAIYFWTLQRQHQLKWDTSAWILLFEPFVKEEEIWEQFQVFPIDLSYAHDSI